MAPANAQRQWRCRHLPELEGPTCRQQPVNMEACQMCFGCTQSISHSLQTPRGFFRLTARVRGDKSWRMRGAKCEWRRSTMRRYARQAGTESAQRLRTQSATFERTQRALHQISLSDLTRGHTRAEEDTVGGVSRNHRFCGLYRARALDPKPPTSQTPPFATKHLLHTENILAKSSQ